MVVCAQLCDAPHSLSPRHGKQVFDSSCLTLLGAPGSSLLQWASWDGLFLYPSFDLQQKCINKSVLLLTGYDYRFEAPEKQIASMRSLKVVWWFSQSTVLAVPWPCCFSSSASIYHSLNSSHIVDAQCLASHWHLGSLSNNDCKCWHSLCFGLQQNLAKLSLNFSGGGLIKERWITVEIKISIFVNIYTHYCSKRLMPNRAIAEVFQIRTVSFKTKQKKLKLLWNTNCCWRK